jgi:protocatechuate 3,4-dioxygenase beta subunit
MMTVHRAILLLLLLSPPGAWGAQSCPPTPWDEIGPFYRPNAPVRSTIGTGYVLAGTVRSTADCRPIAGARIEVWQTGPDGNYDDAHRATLLSDKKGRYRLQTTPPPAYAGRPSHIHILVDAKGFEGLITQHYPKKGARRASFDLVLAPEPEGGGKARNPLGR